MVTEPAGFGDPAYTLALPRVAESAGTARGLVTSALTAWGLRDDDNLAAVIISELMANAYAHAAGTAVGVSVRRMGRTVVRVSVADRSHRMPILRRLDLAAVHGRGLALVEALSGDRWGVELLPIGKRVWAEVRVSEAAEAGRAYRDEHRHGS